jgi:hypothetical protein
MALTEAHFEIGWVTSTKDKWRKPEPAPSTSVQKSIATPLNRKGRD